MIGAQEFEEYPMWLLSTTVGGLLVVWADAPFVALGWLLAAAVSRWAYRTGKPRRP